MPGGRLGTCSQKIVVDYLTPADKEVQYFVREIGAGFAQPPQLYVQSASLRGRLLPTTYACSQGNERTKQCECSGLRSIIRCTRATCKFEEIHVPGNNPDAMHGSPAAGGGADEGARQRGGGYNGALLANECKQGRPDDRGCDNEVM